MRKRCHMSAGGRRVVAADFCGRVIRVEARGGSGATDFFNLIFVALVGAGAVVGEGLWACEFVVGGGGSDNVAVAGYLAGEASDGTGYLIDLAENDDSREFCVGVARDNGVVEVYAWNCVIDM